MMHDPNDLITLFNDLFRESLRTTLVKGGAEPEYVPAGHADGYARIIFAHDYYASALHEISHWCIAGPARRALPDYGYWYCPDGRSRDQQHAFEAVEVKPQALEWLFSMAAGSPFNISLDNLSGDGTINAAEFYHNVRSQAEHYLTHGMPERAETFVQALKTFYGTSDQTLR
ncbi:elongation factor P hydroxylase [Marinobacter sp.]|uniref:elongation factor P hydroxylase n=1 Tax=Marinobacter sp. TaxID=50741 RepID=UPI002B47D6A0|nr:elongation factor P hydroxylase [Marinobacter sp.]HKK55432.1 elongation factor P hydroxylase [Marinobacter sp.]